MTLSQISFPRKKGEKIFGCICWAVRYFFCILCCRKELRKLNMKTFIFRLMKDKAIIWILRHYLLMFYTFLNFTMKIHSYGPSHFTFAWGYEKRLEEQPFKYRNNYPQYVQLKIHYKINYEGNICCCYKHLQFLLGTLLLTYLDNGTPFGLLMNSSWCSTESFQGTLRNSKIFRIHSSGCKTNCS